MNPATMLVSGAVFIKLVVAILLNFEWGFIKAMQETPTPSG